MAAELVFWKGVWHTVTLPFSDPLLSAGDRRYAAALIVRHRGRGMSQAAAEGAAEAAMYERLYPGLVLKQDRVGTA